jgi:deazaflavin-dependent oxidoreductase (nitroreductase family)
VYRISTLAALSEPAEAASSPAAPSGDALAGEQRGSDTASLTRGRGSRKLWAMATDYQRPGWFTKHAFNPIVAGLTRLGVSLVGSRVLEIRGRKSGEWRRTPVNPLEFEGERYLVAPRGETQWVRNLRASGEGRLRKGRRTERFTAKEVPDEEKLPVLRAYLKKWAWEVGTFFQGVGADTPDLRPSLRCEAWPNSSPPSS